MENNDQFLRRIAEIRDQAIMKANLGDINPITEHVMTVIESIVKSVSTVESRLQVSKRKNKIIVTLLMSKVCILEVRESDSGRVTISSSLIDDHENPEEKIIYSEIPQDDKIARATEEFLLNWYQSLFYT